MINYGNILKRAWNVIWNYRTLWIFGLLLAATIAGGASGAGSGRGTAYNATDQDHYHYSTPVLPQDAPQPMKDFADWFQLNVEPLITHPMDHINTFITIGLVLLGLILFASLIAAFVRYPSETAVMRMVDNNENSGTKVNFKTGWKLGWNKRAFRLWLIDLLLAIPILLSLLVLAGGVMLIVLNVTSHGESVGTVGLVIGIILLVIGIFTLVVLGLLIELVRKFNSRATTIDNLSVKESFRYGWAMFKKNWQPIIVMGLIMFGIGIGFGLVSVVISILLIPAYLVMVIPAILVAFLPALLGFGITSIFVSSPVNWMIGLLVGLPFFGLIVALPILFFQGLYEVFRSTVWTLTYRELKLANSLNTVAATVEPTLPAEGGV